MKSVNVRDAKARLAVLLSEVEKRGKRIVICRNGKSIADLVPHQRLVSMAPDKKLGRIKIKYDPVEEVRDDDLPQRPGWSPRILKAIGTLRPELPEGVDEMTRAIRSHRSRKPAPDLLGTRPARTRRPR